MADIAQSYTKKKQAQAAKENKKASFTDGLGKNGGGTVADMVESKRFRTAYGWAGGREYGDSKKRKLKLIRGDKAANKVKQADKAATGHKIPGDPGPFKEEKAVWPKYHTDPKTGLRSTTIPKEKQAEYGKHVMKKGAEAAKFLRDVAKKYRMNKEDSQEEIEGQAMFEAMRGRFNRYYGNPDRKSMHGVMPASKSAEKPKDTFDVEKAKSEAAARLKAKAVRREETLFKLSKGMNDAYAKIGKKITGEESRIDLIKSIIREAKHSQGGGKKRVGQENEGDSHPINIARKAIGLGFPVTIHHHNKSKTDVTPQMGHHILNHYGSLEKSHEKEEMVHHMLASSDHLKGYLGGNKLELGHGHKKAWHPGDPVPEHSKKHLKSMGLPSK